MFHLDVEVRTSKNHSSDCMKKAKVGFADEAGALKGDLPRNTRNGVLGTA